MIDDGASVNSKATHLTSATISSKGTIRSTRSTRSRRKKRKAEWRLVIRDGFANLFDLVGDWVYFCAVYNRDLNDDQESDKFGPLQVEARLLIHAVFAFCILSTTLVCWFALTYIWKRTGMNSMCCNCTVDRILMASLILEDVPQILLTIFIDYRYMAGLTPAGMLNICSSLNSLVNRMTAHYDEIEEDIFVIVNSYKEMP